MAAPSRSAKVADALAAWLNDPERGFGFAFTAVRTWNPLVEYPDLSALTVLVAADRVGPQEDLTRGLVTQVFTCFVSVRQRYTPTGAIPEEWLDRRVELVEQMAEALDHELLVAPTDRQWRVLVPFVDPVCDPLDADQGRQFTAIIEVPVEETRAR